MSRTITALFDTRADAEAGRARLLEANVDADNIRIHDADSSGLGRDGDMTTGSTMGGSSMAGSTTGTTTGSAMGTTGGSMADRTTLDRSYGATGTDGEYDAHRSHGFWASIKNAFLPDEDRATYEEGIRRGGYLLTADVDEDEVDHAVAALENAHGSVDMEQRSSDWKNAGWAATPAMFGRDRTETAKVDTARMDTARTDMGTRTTGTNDAIPIVEEQLVVGKREVERGGVRVRSYVTEKPVHEQIRLRQEHVNVERRPVDRPLSDADNAFRERTVEMTERGEEAVVGKTARVVEEVVLSKSADERVEDVNETVRRTDVEVENLTGANRTSGTTTGTVAGTARGAAESLGDKARDVVDKVKDAVTGDGTRSGTLDGDNLIRSGDATGTGTTGSGTTKL